MIIALVPAFNEEKRIGSVIRSLFEHVDQVVVIDDCSTDQTLIRAEQAGAVVLRHKLNRGQGAALQTGHEYALKKQVQLVVHFDGDGQFQAHDIPLAINKLKDSGADVLLGSRFLGVKSNIPYFKKYFILPVSRIINRLLTGLKLSDVHNGFRILNEQALVVIKISQDRMAHSSEIPALIKKHNLKYVEHPVAVKYHEYGQGASGGFKILSDLLISRFVK